MTGRRKSASAHLPPLRFPWLTRWYDTVLGATTRERTWRLALLDQVILPSRFGPVLDLGCGTATLTLLLAARHPAANVIGIDANAQALAIGRAKAQSRAPHLLRAMAGSLPLADGSIDVVVSSLFFHHLGTAAKSRALLETLRVLRPGGRLYVADWGRPAGVLARIGFMAVQALDGCETTRDSLTGALPNLMSQAGFRGVREVGCVSTPLGTVRLWSARAGGRVSLGGGSP
jgi:ubiquinone/menaquinone biosynthesis C-methylase UbiE